MLRKVALGLGGAAGVGATVAYCTDEGSRRSITFWKGVFPMYLHYRFIQLLNTDLRVLSDEKADVIFESLHERYTDRTKNLTFELRGFYLKQAQLMSMQDHFVPPAFMRWVKDTQDNLPSEFKGSEAKEYVAAKLKEEQGLEFDDVFAEWEDAPIGVASIGQVHRAKLRATGKTVAVKFLVPGLEVKFKSDVGTMKAFCRLAMPQHLTALEELERQFLTEFDYVAEARNMAKVRENILPEFANAIEVPQAHTNLCSKHILVMDYLDGVKLADGVRRQLGEFATSIGSSLEELELERLEKIRQGTFQFKTLQEQQSEQWRMKALATMKDLLFSDNILRFAYNISPIRWFAGGGSMEYKWSPMAPNLGEIITLLAKVQAKQLFFDGFFNADCHPGNVLLLKNGKLGLIDFGQMKDLSIEERIIYAKLIIAHARMDKDEVIRIHFEEQGTKTRYSDPEIAYRMSAFYNDRNTHDVNSGMNIAVFMDWLEARDPMVLLPQRYIMAARSSLILRGIGNAFGFRLRIAELWREDAERFLKEQGVEY